jgi:transposase
MTCVEGLPMRQVALRLGISYHSVRKQCDAFRALTQAPTPRPTKESAA